MVDYSVDENFQIHLTAWDDFATVDGLEEFEQDVAIRLHHNLENLYNDPVSRDTIKERIKLQISRVAREFGVINSIEEVKIEEILTAEQAYRVEVTYNTGDTFVEEL